MTRKLKPAMDHVKAYIIAMIMAQREAKAQPASYPGLMNMGQAETKEAS